MNDEIFLEQEFSEDGHNHVTLENVEREPEVISQEVQEPDLPEEPRASRKQDDWRKQLFRDARDVLYMLAIFMLVYILCFRTVVVVGSSMYDTLMDGDRLLLVNNLLYWEPQQGDVIVASKDSFRDGECIIKRVIATEGQEVDINFETGTVFIDGVAIDEPYIYSPTTDYAGVQFPVVVPEGCLFVMGDNRGNSQDSRSPAIGFIDKREVLGKAVFLMIPGDPDGSSGPEQRDFSRIGVIG